MAKRVLSFALLLVFLSRGYFAFAQDQPADADWKSQAPDVLNKTDNQFPQTNWWEAFQDAPLDQLIETALKNNPSLQGMKTQIAAAVALSKSYRAPLLPALSFAPQYNYNVYGQNQFIFPITERAFQAFIVPLDATYEVDLSGKNMARYQSSKKQIDIAKYQYETARIQLAGMVAAVYFNIAKWRRMQSLAQEQLEASRKLLSHGQGLLELGQATLFDIQNERQRLDQAQVDVTQFSVNRQIAENQLIALLGQSPTTTAALSNVTPWEDLHWPALLDIGVPSRLVVHRPDVAIAEAQLAAANLDVEAARRAFLPTLLLNGSLGYNAVGLQNLFLGSSISTFLAATFSQFIFDGGRRRAELDLRKAYVAGLVANYQNSLINAFTDAENSLAVLRADQIIYQDVAHQTEAARRKAHEDQRKYKVGIQGEPPWLASEVERLDYEKALTQQKVQMLIDVVSVAKAMGGGFQAPAQITMNRQ